MWRTTRFCTWAITWGWTRGDIPANDAGIFTSRAARRASFFPGDPAGYRAKSPFTWGGAANGSIFFNDINTAFRIEKLGKLKSKGQRPCRRCGTRERRSQARQGLTSHLTRREITTNRSRDSWSGDGQRCVDRRPGVAFRRGEIVLRGCRAWRNVKVKEAPVPPSRRGRAHPSIPYVGLRIESL